MDYVRLGSTGLKVSRLCLGMMTYGSPEWHPWTLDEAASRPFVRRALECGINFFDTADMYSRGISEEVTGRALKEYARRHRRVAAPARHGLRRPVSDPPIRLRDADRGDDGRPRCHCAVGQGTLHR